MTDPVSATGAPAGVPLGASPGTTSGATRPDPFGKDTFLKLLVAQLRYQDPMSPADGTAFLAQTAQFTSLEKLSAVATQTADSLAVERMLSASSLVGRTVTYAGPAGSDVSGVVSSARFTPDGPVLRVGAVDVPLAQVKEVRATPAA